MNEQRFYIQCDEYNAWSVWEKNKDMIVFDLFQPDALIICNELNELSDENEQLKKKIKKILQKRYDKSKEDYERAVKAGMPSLISYDEMEIYEELAKEIGVDLDE